MYFRDGFRDARARAFRDAEAYQEVLFSIERFGAALTGEIGSLWTYGPEIMARAKASPLAEDVPLLHRDWHVPFPDLYEVVRDARNDALHHGASARHLTAHATQLVLVLEDALNTEATKVGDYMVRDPISAFPWQPVSFVRQQMLSNSFTYLPIWHTLGAGPGWHLLSDRSVAKYLRSATSKTERKKRLASTVQEAVGSGGLTLEEVHCCTSNMSLAELLDTLDDPIVLVVDDARHDRLVGILTPADLL